MTRYATIRWTERSYGDIERPQTMQLVGTPEQIADKVREQVLGSFAYDSRLTSIEVIPIHPSTVWVLD